MVSGGAVGQRLLPLLTAAEATGLLAPGSAPAQLAHGVAFVEAVEARTGPPRRWLDVGSGGGLPGLVLALQWPEATGTLCDSRTRSVEFLRAAVGALGLEGRVAVVHDRVEHLGRTAARGTYDLVTCRAVAPPPVSAEWCAPLVEVGGWLAISEPPGGHRWDTTALAQLGLGGGETVRHGDMTLRLLPKRADTPSAYPRRVARKRPLWAANSPD
jgi:16S rRNA (guanine527-N7)-methyltransferase